MQLNKQKRGPRTTICICCLFFLLCQESKGSQSKALAKQKRNEIIRLLAKAAKADASAMLGQLLLQQRLMQIRSESKARNHFCLCVSYRALSLKCSRKTITHIYHHISAAKHKIVLMFILMNACIYLSWLCRRRKDRCSLLLFICNKAIERIRWSAAKQRRLNSGTALSASCICKEKHQLRQQQKQKKKSSFAACQPACKALYCSTEGI